MGSQSGERRKQLSFDWLQEYRCLFILPRDNAGIGIERMARWGARAADLQQPATQITGF